LETIVEKLMQRTFRKSTGITDFALVICFFAFAVGVPLSLLMWKLTESLFFRNAGVISFVLALGSICVALAGQSLNQVFRGIAWKMGKKADFFESEKSLMEKYSPRIKRTFDLLKRFKPLNNRGFRPRANSVAQNNRPAHHNARTNARSCRTQSRPTFTHTSSSSGSDDSSDGESGSGDEPPKHGHSLTPHFSYFLKNLNSKSYPCENHGCCRMGGGMRLERRWFY